MPTLPRLPRFTGSSIAAAGVDLPAVIELVGDHHGGHDDEDEEAGKGKAQDSHVTGLRLDPRNGGHYSAKSVKCKGPSPDARPRSRRTQRVRTWHVRRVPRSRARPPRDPARFDPFADRTGRPDPMGPCEAARPG